MKPAWKKVAWFADKPAFEVDQVCGAVSAAYTDDWRTDVSDDLMRTVCEVFTGEQDLLLGDQRVLQLEGLRRMAAGHGMGQLFIDCAVQQVISNKSGVQAAVDAAADTLAIWGARYARQIEEHFHRESTQQHAQNVRSRIEEGVGSVPREALARQLLRLDSTPAPRTPPKQTGLDAGVRL
jgi:hypothetical protein